MKLTKHAKSQKKKRKIQTYKVVNAFLKGDTLMRCPYTQRHIISHKDTTVVLCPEKKTVITTYPNDYQPSAKLADVLDFTKFKNELRNNKPESSSSDEVELSYEEYQAMGKKKAA